MECEGGKREKAGGVEFLRMKGKEVAMKVDDRVAILAVVLMTGTLLSGCITFMPSVEAEYCCGTSRSLPEAQRAVVGLAGIQAAVADPSNPVSNVWIDRMEDRETLGTKSKLSPNADDVSGTVVVLSPGEYVVVMESTLGERTLEVVDTSGQTTTIKVPARMEAALNVKGGGYYKIDSDGEKIMIAEVPGVRDLVGAQHRIKY